ncbi:single-stranded DNA-binding protein [uncultured Caudovirales phage]|uniref:Single-stranded DNA-binding protein n=1 Tax=uncultured Caudovirales phage TaxID=2100421 RepID=A0A6J5LAS9_9CAUD|nr:single-stranded DNA-binding protein [uncultured Caudovirales phage]
MNQGTFAGYLGRDADLRSTQTGKKVAGLSVGVQVGYGQNKSTLWVDGSMWGDRAEKLMPYLNKGQAVVISGEVGIRTYQAKDGTTKATMTCNISQLTLMGGGEKKPVAQKGPGPEAQAASAPQAGPEGAATGPVTTDFDDDVPF